MAKAHWSQTGQEPDYRFSLANERTFLAWIRTALTLLGGGVLLEQFATKLEPRMVVLVLGVFLATFASVLCGVAYWRWKANEIAIRQSLALPRSWAIPLLAVGALCVSAVIAVLLILQ